MADDDMIMLKGCKSTRAVTVLLRGANDYMLDEMDRSLHDAFCIVKRVLESGTVVPGKTQRGSLPASHVYDHVLACLHVLSTCCVSSEQRTKRVKQSSRLLFVPCCCRLQTAGRST